MKVITGTHVYRYHACARAVQLDLHGDRERRRPASESEEFSLRRGRELEAEVVATLGYAEPTFPARDFEAGAAATEELMRAGVEGIAQGVLRAPGRLGIPDLLRRVEGKSVLGAHHYVVGDIKSSARARGDQILQIMFYTRLLSELQQREPAFAFLLLKDGHEERFAPFDYADVAADVEEQVRALATGKRSERPFLIAACASCRWSELCLSELEAAGDLSLLQGMTRGMRACLERVGLHRTADLCAFDVARVAARTDIEAAELRRLQGAARAHVAGKPILLSRPRGRERTPAALVHVLRDPFSDRLLYIGVLHPASSSGAFLEALPRSREEELEAFTALVAELPRQTFLWHHGGFLPRWYEEAAWQRSDAPALEDRMLDLQKHLRGAAAYPGPVFGMEDQVRLGLGLDPRREGSAAAAALWARRPEGPAWLRNKGRSDLLDLARLREELLPGGGDGKRS